VHEQGHAEQEAERGEGMLDGHERCR